MQHRTPNFLPLATIQVTLATPLAQSTPRRAHCGSGSAFVLTGRASGMSLVTWQLEMPFEKKCSLLKVRTCMTSLITGRVCRHSRSSDCEASVKIAVKTSWNIFLWMVILAKEKFERTCWIKFCLLVIFGMLGVKNIVQRARTTKLCLVFESHYSVRFYTSL